MLSQDADHIVLETQLLLFVFGRRHIPDSCGEVQSAAGDDPVSVGRPLDVFKQLLMLLDFVRELNLVSRLVDHLAHMRVLARE